MQIPKILEKVPQLLQLSEVFPTNHKNAFRRMNNQTIVNDSCQIIIDIGKRKERKNTNSEVSSRSFFNAVKSICRRDIIHRRQIDVGETPHAITKRYRKYV